MLNKCHVLFEWPLKEEWESVLKVDKQQESVLTVEKMWESMPSTEKVR